MSRLPPLRWRKWLFRSSMAFAILASAFALGLALTPFPAELLKEPLQSAEFVDRNGVMLREVLAEERRYSQRCTLDEISPALIAATISAEDQRFYKHPGVDPLAVTRALWQLLRGKPPASGASTITMQLVKIVRADAATSLGNHTQSARRTLARKLTGAWLALRIERTWTKDHILAEYLNRLDFGNLQVGVATASRFYFGKPPIDLSTDESALLAALPKAPTRLNPHTHRADANARAQWVLQRMETTGRLAPETLRGAGLQSLALLSPMRNFAAPAFVDLLLSRRDTIPERGGTIRTTLDLALNIFAERTLLENLRGLADKNATAGAAVVIDNRTGKVLALACASTDEAGATNDVNTAWMIRSPGSAVKPFTYLLALENGAEPCTVVADVPTDFPTPTGSYRPNNYNHRFYGPVSLRFALGNSLNVAALRTLELAGGEASLQRALQSAGISTLDHPADYYGLGLTLGNGEVRLLELVNAYASLARLGVYRPFHLLQSNREKGETGSRIFSAKHAWLLADMLADNSARASSFGLDSYLAFDFPVACKTGTSSDYRDNWCLGFTPEFTVGVWVGNANGKPMRGITGVTGAAPAFHEIFEHLHATRGTSWYPRPAEILSCTVEPLTGHRVAQGTRGAVDEKCATLPPEAIAEDRDVRGRFLLDPQYAEWLRSTQNSLGNLVALTSETSREESQTPLAILSPPAGSVFFYDPDLPPETQCIPLRAATSTPVAWQCDSLSLAASTDGATRVRLVEGRHLLTVHEPSTGRDGSTWIEVRSW